MTASATTIAYEAYQHQGACQRYGELAAAVEFVASVPHGLVAEIGVMQGGTLYCWRELGAEVYAITLPVPNPAAVKDHGAEIFWGDSHGPEARQWLGQRLGGRLLDVLFIDGDHSYDGARADVEDYTPFVRPGGVVLIHDVLNEPITPDVMRLWAELTGEFEGHTQVLPADPVEPAGFGVIWV